MRAASAVLPAANRGETDLPLSCNKLWQKHVRKRGLCGCVQG